MLVLDSPHHLNTLNLTPEMLLFTQFFYSYLVMSFLIESNVYNPIGSSSYAVCFSIEVEPLTDCFILIHINKYYDKHLKPPEACS